MQHTRRAGLAGLTCLALIVTARPASALVAARPIAPVPQRVAQSDVVVVGKVTMIEPKTVQAERSVNDRRGAEYTIAIVKVDEAIQGAKGLTHIKVGFLPAPVPPKGVPVRPGIGIRPVRSSRPRLPRIRPASLSKGQEVCLFLRPHHKEAFYIMPNPYDVIDKKAKTFEKDVEQAKKATKAFADPMAGLKSKDAKERYQTAAMLVLRYRARRPGPVKEEAIPAEESKLILEALAGGNWNAPRTSRADPMQPQRIFYMLQPQQHGFVRPQRPQEFAVAAAKWLKNNAGKYRVKRFVSGKAEK